MSTPVKPRVDGIGGICVKARDPGALRMVPPSPGAVPALRPPARLLDVSWMRGQRVARVAIAPASYEPARGRLTGHHRSEVEGRRWMMRPLPWTSVNTRQLM